jgi:hypothetical protein
LAIHGDFVFYQYHPFVLLTARKIVLCSGRLLEEAALNNAYPTIRVEDTFHLA